MEVLGGFQASSSVDAPEHRKELLVWIDERLKIESEFVVSASTCLRSGPYSTRG